MTIESLDSGGRERQCVELLTYLKDTGKYELFLILTKPEIHYQKFFDLNISYAVVQRKHLKKDPRLFYYFYRVIRSFNPRLIHSWGNLATFYSLPASLLLQTPMINFQIQDAPPQKTEKLYVRFMHTANFHFSDINIANSRAGLALYRPPPAKSRVIYNGINPARFRGLPPEAAIKKKYGIETRHAVVMVATFSQNKDYDLFYKVAAYIHQTRKDITFIGAGGPKLYDRKFERIKALAEGNPDIRFPGRVSDVEALINACDIGVLFSNKSVHGEGIPNAVLEYMALGKPVIASDAGGTKEAIKHNENGYLVQNESVKEIAGMIVELIDNTTKRKAFGNKGKELIDASFTLKKMGNAFEDVYHKATTLSRS